jgi:hypothetical protein
VSMERFKVDIARGIAALLPYARDHVVTQEIAVEEIMDHGGPRPERCHEFPPYRLALTVQPIEGLNLHMVQVCAKWRPVKVLNDQEKLAVNEAMGDCFPGHSPTALPTDRPISGFTVLIVPDDVPPETRKVLGEYRAT